MPRKATTNPMILLPHHPSAVIVRIGRVATYGYYVAGTFDDVMGMWQQAREADAVVTFEITSQEGITVACHHSEIVSVIDCRTRTD
jgi:hypothetical protein